MSGKVAATHRGVSREDDRKMLAVPALHLIEQLLVQSFRHVPLIDIGHGDDEPLSGDVDNQLFQMVSIYTADGVNVQCLPRCAENVVLRAAVMIAGCDDDGHSRIGIMNLDECISEHRLYGCRRLRSVVHIATKEKYVGLLFLDNVHHLQEH